MPVIRYRTRDLTRLLPGTARPGMRRMEKVTGRTDDMIILRGVNLFPTQIEEIVLRTPGLSPHFALELTTRGRMDHLDGAGRGAPRLPGRAARPGRRARCRRASRTPSAPASRCSSSTRTRSPRSVGKLQRLRPRERTGA